MYRLLRWCAILACLIFGIVACLLFIRRVDFPQSVAPIATFQPGLTYTNQRIARVPWSIHVLQIDRAQTNLGIYSAHAGRRVLGVSLIDEQARAVPREIGTAIAGINGDFYVRDDPTFAGDPRGLQIVNGELISGPDSVCVWFDRDGNPHLDDVEADFAVTWPDGSKTAFGLNERRRSGTAVLYTPTYGHSTQAAGGRELILQKEENGPWLPLRPSQTYRARVRGVSTRGNTRLSSEILVLSIGPRMQPQPPEAEPGTVVEISTATTPDLNDVKAAIAGGPALIKDGNVLDLRRPPDGGSDDFSERSKFQRHPRSVMAWSPTHIYFVVVDGRQPGLSVGMKLAELAHYLRKLGCTDAMNLDGGKSAQMWLNGEIVNSPVHGEDTVANCLLVVRKGSSVETGELAVTPPP
jgi:hypothetical protein